MKKYYLGLAFFVILLIAACVPGPYSVVKQTTPAASLSQVGTISVGWLNLDETKWKDYGFDEKSGWETLVLESNTKSLPQYLKQLMPGKTILMVNSKAEEPKAEGLVVKFSDAVYNYNVSSAAVFWGGGGRRQDTLDLTIHFIDGRSGQELDAVTVSVGSHAGSEYSQYKFEGRFTNSIYNLARYISDRVR